MAEYFGKHHSYLVPQDNYYTRKISNALKDALSLNPGQAILEIGCGAGRFSIPLLDQGLSMTCIDTSRELLDVFQDHLTPQRRAQILCQDVYHFNGRFDAVIGFFVLHHFDDHRPLFDKFRSFLNEGGSIGFIEPNPFNPLYYLAPFFYKGISFLDELYYMCDRDRLARNLSAAGFKGIQVKKFGFLPPQIMNLKIGPALDRLTEKCVPRLCHLVMAHL